MFHPTYCIAHCIQLRMRPRDNNERYISFSAILRIMLQQVAVVICLSVCLSPSLSFVLWVRQLLS